MNKLTKHILSAMVLIMVLSLFALPMFALASGDSGDLDFGLENAQDIGLGQADLKDTINSVIRVILGFLGIIAVIIILWGGFIWMTASGDENKTKKAKDMIIAGIIGLVIILAAYVIASFVITAINNAVQA